MGDIGQTLLWGIAGVLFGASGPAAAQATLHWVHSQSGSPLPDGAMVGGQENGGPLVVCRADWAGNLYPGKLVRGNCNIAVGGAEQPVNIYDVLVGTGGQWRPASGGLSGGFVAGYEGDKPLVLCQAPYRGGLHPGKVVAGRCNISFGGREIPVTPFGVFVAGAPSAAADYRYANAPAFFYALPVFDPGLAAMDRQRQADLDAQQRAINAQRAQIDQQQRQQAQREADQRQRDAEQRARQAQQQQALEQQRAALAAQQRADAEAAAARQRAEGEAEENRLALQAQAEAEAEAKARADAEAQKQAEIRNGEEEENRMAAEAERQAAAEAQKQAEIRQGEEEENRMAAEAEKAAAAAQETTDSPPQN